MAARQVVYVVVVEIAEISVHLPVACFYSVTAAKDYLDGRGDRYQIRRMTTTDARRIIAACDQRLMEHCAHWHTFFETLET